jgi:ADP-ribosyltransferase exoenzyme
MTNRTTASGIVPTKPNDAPDSEIPLKSSPGSSVVGAIQVNLAATTEALVPYHQLERIQSPDRPSSPLINSEPLGGEAHLHAISNLRDDRTSSRNASPRTRALARSWAFSGKLSKMKVSSPAAIRPRPPLTRQARQDVLLPPSREEFESYFAPDRRPEMPGTMEEKKQFAAAMKSEVQEREWVKQLPNKPPLGIFSINNFRICAYSAEHDIPAASLLSIVTYTGDDFRHINADMRREKTLHLGEMSDSVPPWKREMIHDISKGLQLLPKAQKGIVCRKLIVNEELGQRLLPGVVFMDYAFMSTSYLKNFNGIPGNYMFVIALKKNSSAVDVSGFSRSPQEKEVLFPPGQQFKILSREIDGVPNNEHVPYFDYDPDGQHKDMSAEEVQMRRRVVKIYVYQI